MPQVLSVAADGTLGHSVLVATQPAVADGFLDGAKTGEVLRAQEPGQGRDRTHSGNGRNRLSLSSSSGSRSSAAPAFSLFPAKSTITFASGDPSLLGGIILTTPSFRQKLDKSCKIRRSQTRGQIKVGQ